MEQELVQIFELLVALVAAIAAYWQHRQKSQAVVAREEALVEKEVAEACSGRRSRRRTMLSPISPPTTTR